MTTLREDLRQTLQKGMRVCFRDDLLLEGVAAQAWVESIIVVLRRHKYDLMQLACVRKTHPNIDRLPAPERDTSTPTVEIKDGTATAYFKDDPQGKGW